MSLSALNNTKLPARLYRRSGLNCPHCRAIFENQTNSCPRCGFHMGLLDQQMPGPGPEFQPLMDYTGVAQGAKNAVEKRANRIRKFFPQVSSAVCFINCPEPIPPNMMASWVLNHSPENGAGATWRGLLLVDPTRSQHSFASGYELETFLAREQLEKLLDEAGQLFYFQEWEAGSLVFFDGLFDLLEQSCKHAHSAKKELRRELKQ
jgi:hypothetical protein